MNNTSIQDAHVVCIQCGYNLSGVPLGGSCPECGTPVSHSLERPLPTSGYAIASLVLGILSLVTCACYGVLAFPLGLMAVIYAGRADKQIRQHEAGASSQGLATAGRICGWIGLVLGAIVIAIMAVFIISDRL